MKNDTLNLKVYYYLLLEELKKNINNSLVRKNLDTAKQKQMSQVTTCVLLFVENEEDV